MTSQTDELLNCAHCDSSGRLRYDEEKIPYIECRNKDCTCQIYGADDSVECAIKAWNTRAPQPEIDRLKRVMDATKRLLQVDGGQGSKYYNAIECFDARSELREALAAADKIEKE